MHTQTQTIDRHLKLPPAHRHSITQHETLTVIPPLSIIPVSLLVVGTNRSEPTSVFHHKLSAPPDAQKKKTHSCSSSQAKHTQMHKKVTPVDCPRNFCLLPTKPDWHTTFTGTH
jgi:hypothetical protein